MAQSPEMESPSACQEYLVEAQEDSTSVDPASASSTTTMTTTMTTTLAEDAARQPVNENLRDLVMVCERINENSEKGELEERQSSGNLYSEKKEKEEDAKEKEEKEVDQRMEDTASEDKEDSMKEFLQEPEESGVRAVTPHDLDSEETRLKDSTCISRKRSAESDFLPIGGEVKRMGLEISEEQAMQLKNDIRRLSPVLVSMRERTLGEVSLTSESCSFKNDFVGGKTMSKDNDSYDESLQRNESSIENCARKDVDEAKHEVVAKTVDASFSAERTSYENIESTSDREERKVVCDSQQESLDVDVASSCDGFDETMESNRHDDVTDTGSASGVLAENCVDETAVVSNLVCRPLLVVLNRIENVDVIKTKDGAVEKDSPHSERKRNLAEEECSASKKQQYNDSSPMTRSRASELELVRSPNNLVLKKCKVVLKRINNDGVAQPVNADETGSTSQKLEKDEPAPVSVIGQLEEDEEVVLASSSLSSERDQVFNELDSSETMPSSPEEMSEPTMDVVEGVDTETETETGSDSSEVSPIASIRELRDVDIASNQLPCPEAEPLCCVEAMAPIMRLETDQPETYTEDSAESLALATGARDDVRSDGSDSGLGNEIPGDSGPAPAPESDSETSFLDRLPDDILSDKEKGMNQLDNFATSSDAPGIPEQPPMTSFRTLPAKSNLKRRLIDCMESEHESQSNTEEPMKKKRNIHFDAVTVYYFPRAQGFTCVPSQGGSTLGMSATHTHAERFSLSEHAAEQRRLHRARLAQLRSERNCAINCVTETASSSEDPSDDTDEEPSDNEDLDIDSYYFLQPVPTSQRRALLRAAGVRRIDAVEKDECRDIRASREHCGCGCKGYCDPESCPCSRANVKCQVDRPGFPCGCTRDGCANSSGRIEFNPIRVRTHFIHTLMRLELEKKQREEEGSGGDHDQTDNQGHGSRSGNGSLRNIGSLGSVMDTAGNGDVCTIPGGGGGGGFTTLHYETSHDSVTGIVTASCQPEVPGTREDSLDLYAIRDDCYPSEDAVDGSQSIVQRKLHPEFSQAFQSFSPGGAQNSGGNGGGMGFQQSSYQDYGSPYAGLPSSSRVPQFQPPQFQSPVPAPPNPAAFSHYGPYSVTQNTASAGLQGNCTAQVHQVPPPGQQQHSSYETAVFAQDDATSTTQYTNLTNSVQPMNPSVVQQMQQNKLEPFSELLSGRYSYYGEMHEPQQHHGHYGTHGATSKVAEIVESGQVAAEQSESMPEDCDENFGEIIKKSMVETVSA